MGDSGYYKEMSLNKWSAMFRDIYFPAQNYARSAVELFTHLVKVFGAGSHFLFRANDAKGSRQYVAKVFAWYCALANRLGLDLEEAVWQKYPGVCPRCLASVCECSEPPASIDPDRLSIVALEKEHTRPRTLREWQNMFAHIYRGPSGKATVAPSRERIALVFARIAEELGEVAEALGQDPAIDPDAQLVIKNEMADLAAWIFSLANNLQYVDPSAHGGSLADVAWELYPGKCHRCSEIKCICVRGVYGLELAEKGAMAPSHWDERTGLANDKALRRYIAHVESLFPQGGDNYVWSMIFLDLDNFGAINKTHGHQVGDEVLRAAAENVRKTVGNSGIVFRRGGEEFVVVLHRGKEIALSTAEKIRRVLGSSPISIRTSTGESTVTVTASLGVAACLVDVNSPQELEPLAEARAREAKAAGKNRVIPELSAEQLRAIRAVPSIGV